MTLNVSLSPQLESMIKAKVESGLYNSASEVVREGLRLLEEQDRFQQIKLEMLRTEIEKGRNSGPSIPAIEVFKNIRQTIQEIANKK